MARLVLRSSVVESAGVTYTPWYADAWDQGTVSSISPIIYASGIQGVWTSNAIAGPFGEAKVQRITPFFFSDGDYFGGTISDGVGGRLSRNLPIGTETWWRIYYYFPSSWCAGADQGKYPANDIDQSDTPDGSANWKWLRLYFGPSGSPTGSLVCKIAGLANHACASASAGPYMLGVAVEGAADGTGNDYLTSTPAVIPRNQWVALQWYLKHGTTTGTSEIRMWMNSTYLGSVPLVRALHSGAANEKIFAAVLGDYCNGGAEEPYTDCYVSNAIFTDDPPNTLDSGGRPYIAPATRITDF